MATAPRRRTQAERRNASEEALVAAAADLIAERGVVGASLARIGTRAGASSGLPIHHFGSKDALMAAVAGRTQRRIRTAIAAALERENETMEHSPALEVIRIMVRTYLDMFEHPASEERALIVLWGSTFPAEASIDGMVDADHVSYEGWLTLIERGRREGSIRADVDPRAASVLLLGLIRGVVALEMAGSVPTDMAAIRSTCDAWVVASLAPTPAGPDAPETPSRR